MKDPLDISGGNTAVQIIAGALLYGYCGVRALTYPLRYAAWRLKGNGLQKTPDGKEVLIYHDPKPTVFFPVMLIAFALCFCGCTSTSMFVTAYHVDGSKTTYDINRISIAQKVDAKLIAPDGVSLVYSNNGGPLTQEALTAIIEGAIKAAGVAAK